MLVTNYLEFFLSSVLQKHDDDVYWLLGLPPDETPSFTLQEQQGASDDRREATGYCPRHKIV